MASTASANQPIYQRVRDHFVAQIEQGALEPHSKLPSERALSETLKISRTTARQAFIQLEGEGFVYRSDRRGWFVAPPRLQYSLSGAASFFVNVTTEGGKPGSRILSAETMIPPRWVRERLRLGPKERVHKVRRLRMIGGEPAMIEEGYMPARRCPDFLTLDLSGSFQEIWTAEYGIHTDHHEVSLRLTALTCEEAALLGVEPESAGILVTQAIFDSDHRPIYVENDYWCGDAAVFTVSGRIE